MSAKVFVVLPFCVLILESALRAQDPRTQLEEAVNAYEEGVLPIDTAIARFRIGLNPAIGAQDSIWARALQYLVVEKRDTPNEARAWALFGMHLRPSMRYNESYVVGGVRALLDSARTWAQSDPDDDIIETRYVWPNGDPGEATGRLSVSGVSDVGVSVQGEGTAPSQDSLVRVADAYTLVLAADGFQSRTVRRPILPGITTFLTARLPLVAIATDSIAPETLASVQAQLALLRTYRYGVEVDACATAVFVGRELALTTYGAIRGGDSVVVERADGSMVVAPIQVAAHDFRQNVAILQIDDGAADSVPLVSSIAAGQYAWRVNHPACGDARVTRTQVAAWDPATEVLRVGEPMSGTDGVLIDQDGAVVGITVADNEEIPATVAQVLVAQARRNIAAGQLLSPGEVARNERHIFGSVEVRSNIEDAVVTVESRSDWHWPESRQSEPVPFEFAGPMGTYAVTLTTEGRVVRELEFEVRPGETQRLQVDSLPTPPPPPPPGGFPVVWALLGAAAVGVGALLLFLGGEKSGTATIVIELP